MKNLSSPFIFSFFAVIIFSVFSCSDASENGGTSDENEESVTYYGSVVEQTNLINGATIRKQLTNSNEASVKVRLEGTIVSTCAKKGCWMDVASDGDTIFVKFKDYDFFVPTEGVEGFRTVVEGEAFFDTTSVADLKHFAEDAGKSKDEISLITEPEYRLQFIASGVMIEELN